MFKRILIIWIAAFFVVWPGTLSAQQQPGRIRGRVVDESGNPAANITITVRNAATGTETTAQTDDHGDFVVAELQPGRYFVHTDNSQSTPTTQTQSTVNSASTTDITLQTTTAGQLAVMAEVVTQEESTAPVITTFSDRPIELLPQPNTISRTGEYFGAYNLSLLSEGVTPGSIFQNGVGPSVAGRPNTSNNFHVNGTDNNNQAVPGPLVAVSNEVTTEFALTQSQHSPQIGHSTGGKLNLVLAQGTNAWHGGVYDYLSNRKLNASDPAAGLDRDNVRFDQNRFGGKAGGPLMKDKVFGFFGFEYTPTTFERRLLGTSLAPTPAGFAALLANPAVSRTNLAVLANNVAVSSTPVFFDNVAGTAVPLGIVTTGIKNHQNFFNGIASIDWNMAGRGNLGARYVHNDTGNDVVGSSLPDFAVPGHTRALLGAINYSRTLSSTTAINVNAGYNRLDRSIGGGNFVFPGQTAFPNIGIEDIGLTLGPNIGIGRAKANTYQLSGEWDSMFSGHHVTVGADFRDLINTIGNFSEANGNFAFSSLERFLIDLPPDVLARRSFGSVAYNGNQRLLYAFGQDAFRINKATNLELGLGYQYASVPESWRKQASLAGLSVPGLITFGEPKGDSWNFAPRVGIAWAPGAGHTVFRGSIGVLYDALNGSSSFLAPNMTFNSVTSAAPSIPGFFATGGIRPPITAAGSVGTFAFDQELPYILQWNVGATHEFFGRLATEVKYLGNHGVHMPLNSLLNDTGRVTPGASLPVFFTNPGPAVLNSLTLTQDALAARTNAFMAAGFTNPIWTVRPDGTSWYNAAVLKISERFTAGTQVAAQYTYSDTRTDATGTPFDLAFGRSMEQAPWAQKHRATLTPIIDVASMFPKTSGWVRDILANLSLMGTITYASAQRVPLFAGVDTGMNGIGLGSGVFVNPASTSGIGSGVVPLRNTAGSTVAFLAADPNAEFVTGGPGAFSTARPTLKLGDTRNIDLALVKRFSFQDRAKIEIRGDSTNIFNRRQLTGLPVSTLGSGMGFAPTSNFVLLSNPQFNDIRGTLASNPRTFQLALRVLF
jgi:carboxypeptidase family protein